MGQSSLHGLSVLIQRVNMQSTVAFLLVLAAVAQAQYPFYGNGFHNPLGYYGYGYNGLGYNGYGYNGFPVATRAAYAAPVAAYTAPVAAAYTAPVAAPVVASAPVVAASPYYGYGYSASQYRSQDELGQASYGYSHPGQAAANYQDAFGNQVGSYAYINPEGKEVRVSYVADANGFRVLSNDLPVGPVDNLVGPAPVQDTPEVVAARLAHEAAHADAEAGIVAVNTLQPIEDTPEVAAAKIEHAEAHAKALALAESSGDRKKRQVFGFGLNSPYVFNRFAAVHAAVPVVVAAPSVPVREATLTKTVLNPNHAVAYRVD